MDGATTREAARLLAAHDGSTRIAVVGASNDRAKYGYIISADLSGRGYAVLPVNPKAGPLHDLELAMSPNLLTVPDPVHIAVFVVPPPVTFATLQALDPKRFPFVWFQPGSFDLACLDYARQHFPFVAEGDCIMVVARWH